MSNLTKLALVILALTSSLSAATAMAQVQKISMGNGTIAAEITPDIGGRLLSFSLKDQPNFLLLADLASLNTRPQVSPSSDNIGYFGHEIWVGPQSEWWVHQKVNPERAAKKAVWPPDPYLILAQNTVLEQSQEKVILKSPESGVSGVQIIKAYALMPERKNSLKLQVRATNIRKENIAWDIWFNTRVPANAQVYVPVANAADVQQKNLEDATNAALVYTVSDGILSLDMIPPPAGKTARKGKLMIQPSSGWMASFYDKQVFIIQFPLQPKAAIHPEQGQVELYNDFNPAKLQEGLLEMEVHAPYKTLAPKEYMIGEETWTILEYKGAPTRNAHLAFLRAQAAQLGLK
ncbi:hypothetical protein GCM10011613_10550 [Cellvibrio zantedeschiae]|uniref:DUF4380 domain-containing protein n=1 Tax=Cellvibrio zantedeschiae TaxID=1237077 RepID=A0ABQ3AYK9_9GAMM|nr:DUF4380 domain-containing protein [Cellvibrio zantedeschiae]GGY68232.1 hypothetical protein GCM10011613_10550 [Cellvibrio zantedeschiae]